VKLDYTSVAGALAGSRFYLSYSGTAPTAANCVTLATDIIGAFVTNLIPLINQDYSLSEVDVLDISSETGASGVVPTSHAGTDSNPPLPANCAMNVEFQIARRYRGGKPRMYLPPAGTEAMLNQDKFAPSYVASVSSGMQAFFTALAGFSVGAMGTLKHVNLSYYKGFTNIENSSGRERAVPTYRTAALLDPVQGYVGKQVISSQRRRRTATTP
jgi:hypothetical protein